MDKSSKIYNEEILNSIETIIGYTDLLNWSPDWAIFRDVFDMFPNSYSLLTPFAYAYLEEIVRSTTSEYGLEVLDGKGEPIYRKSGKKLFALARRENKSNHDYIKLLNELEIYFGSSKSTDRGDNRNCVMHGSLHSKYWTKESFQKLLYDIARTAPFANF